MSAAKGTRARVVAEAAKHVGYKEKPGNHTIFGKRTGTDGGAWCGAFVDCVMSDAGVKLPGSCVWVPNGVKAFKAADQWHVESPRMGDVVFFDFASGRPQHVGIVADPANWATKGTIVTIEGNTWSGSGRYQGNGDGCYRRVRARKDVLGFGTPKFTASVGTTTATAAPAAADPWPVGHEIVFKPSNGFLAVRGGWHTMHTLGLPKGCHFLMTTQLRLPAGIAAEVRLARLGWGKDSVGGSIDPTGFGWWDARKGASQGQSLTHPMWGGGPVSFQINIPGEGSVHLPTIVCKAIRDH